MIIRIFVKRQSPVVCCFASGTTKGDVTLYKICPNSLKRQLFLSQPGSFLSLSLSLNHTFFKTLLIKIQTFCISSVTMTYDLKSFFLSFSFSEIL